MKPLRKGKARSELAQGLSKLFNGEDVNSEAAAQHVAQRQAAVLGGAIEAALLELKFQSLPSDKEMLETFWRLANENLWRLTRALEASGLLDKVGG